MVIAHTDGNDIDFCVKFEDETQANLVREAIQAGVDAWYQAAQPEIKDSEYFYKEEIESFWDEGYSIPTSILLQRWNVQHATNELTIDDNGNIICDELIRRF